MSKGSTQRPSSVAAEEVDQRWAAVFGKKPAAGNAPALQPEQEPVAWITPDGEGFREAQEERSSAVASSRSACNSPKTIMARNEFQRM